MTQQNDFLTTLLPKCHINLPVIVARISQCLQGHRLDITGNSSAIQSSPVTNYHLCQFFTP